MTREAAEIYHRLTSYEPGREWDVPIDDPRVRHDLTPNDPATLPPPWKQYADGLQAIELPRELPVVARPAGEVLAGRVAQAAAPVDLPSLARLLHLTAGVVRVARRPGRAPVYFRAAGSAGGRFPLELYVVARGVDGLADGVWWYHPHEHALLRVGPPTRSGGATTVVLTGVPWRTGWRYAERGYRHLYWDGGTALSQLLALAAAAAIEARLWTRFPDADVAELVGADGVHEFPLALVTLGAGEPAVEPGGPPVVGRIGDEPQEFPLVTATQRAGDLDCLGDPLPAGAPVDPPGQPTPSLDEVILQRGSTRLMDAGAELPRDALEWQLAVSLRGIEVPHFVAVHGVAGVQPGLYRWPDLRRPLHREASRDELYRVCLEQGLAGDAAYVVIAAASLDDLDGHRYREAQLGAGLVEGRLHLAAYALGAGASGMTFRDCDVERLLREPLAGLLFTCVGVPAYRNTAGGAPGWPRDVRIPEPRLGD